MWLMSRGWLSMSRGFIGFMSRGSARARSGWWGNFDFLNIGESRILFLPSYLPTSFFVTHLHFKVYMYIPTYLGIHTHMVFSSFLFPATVLSSRVSDLVVGR
jgi:hypothetical protein